MIKADNFKIDNFNIDNLILNINSIIKEVKTEVKEEAKKNNNIEVWTAKAQLENPTFNTKEIMTIVNQKALESFTTPNINMKKCIEDCNNCKYLNHPKKDSRTCWKYGNISLKRANDKEYNVKTTLQAHLSEGLKELNDEVLNGSFMDEVNLSTNEKLEGIPTLNMPNIFLQVQFMQFVENNKEFLDLPVVSLLYTYFKKYAMCRNCQYCNGLCYNNKLLNQYKDKCIKELRNLLAYILRREELKKRIKSQIGNCRLFRIHGNGEFHSKESLEFWIEIAKENKGVTFYTYTKSYDIVSDYLKEGNKLPNNFILNISMVDGQQEEIDNKYPLLSDFNKFVIILSKDMNTNKKATVCGGACLQCQKGCHVRLKGKNKIIYVVVH